MFTRHSLTRALGVALILFSLPVFAATPEEIKEAIDKGLKFLRSKQEADGSYGGNPQLTCLALMAFEGSPRKYREDDGPFIRKAIEYVLKFKKPDGGIYDKSVPAYTTALCMMALHGSQSPAHQEAVKGAQAYLVKLQAAEGQGYGPKDKYYGGIGYGSDERPDLNNLQISLEALRRTGLAKDDEVYKRAVAFLSRSQNRSESNDQPWAGNDGGFVYQPGESKAGGTKSYGSMTFAGIKSLLFAYVDKKDPRVQAAMEWVRNNYTLEENPGLGAGSLFYYYNSMAKALTAYGEEVITDARGRKHDWYKELAARLLALQKPDGSWMNDKDPRYWEGNPILATSYIVLALSERL